MDEMAELLENKKSIANLSTRFGTPADSIFQLGWDTSQSNLSTKFGHQLIQSFNLGWTLADFIIFICACSCAMAREWKNCVNNVNSLTVQLEHQPLRQLDSNCVNNVNSWRRLENHLAMLRDILEERKRWPCGKPHEHSECHLEEHVQYYVLNLAEADRRVEEAAASTASSVSLRRAACAASKRSNHTPLSLYPPRPLIWRCTGAGAEAAPQHAAAACAGAVELPSYGARRLQGAARAGAEEQRKYDLL
jgi:hypothetical protein